MITTTIFKSIFDNDTSVVVNFDSFDEFEKSLYYLSTLKGYKPKRGERVTKSTPLMSPAVYRKGTTRANANVIKWTFAALDIDDYIPSGDVEYDLVTNYGDTRFVCYSTASSTDDRPKFRLIFPLTRDVEAAEIPHFWYALNTEFGQMGDTQARDLARMFYCPARYPNANNFIFSNRDGAPLDVDQLLLKHPYIAPKKSDNFFDMLPPDLQKEVIKHREAKLKESGKRVSWTSYNDCPFVSKRLISEYKSIASQDNSGRYAFIYKLMCQIAASAVKKQYPITEYEIVELIRQLDRDTANRYQKRPLNVEATRAITWAFTNAYTT